MCVSSFYLQGFVEPKSGLKSVEIRVVGRRFYVEFFNHFASITSPGARRTRRT